MQFWKQKTLSKVPSQQSVLRDNARDSDNRFKGSDKRRIFSDATDESVYRVEYTFPLDDTQPPDVTPKDHRRGGEDEIEPRDFIPVRRRYTVTYAAGAITDRALNVASPTSTDNARVLGNLIRDLAEKGIIFYEEA